LVENNRSLNKFLGEFRAAFRNEENKPVLEHVWVTAQLLVAGYSYPLNMHLVRKLLINYGFEMLEAMGGFSGLKRIQIEKPDIVLLDINIPGVGGIELIKQMRTMPEIARIPVIAKTEVPSIFNAQAIH
jgi:response regulator RpfG family c-di-GMP phosphodiesterase